MRQPLPVLLLPGTHSHGCRETMLGKEPYLGSLGSRSDPLLAVAETQFIQLVLERPNPGNMFCSD